MGFGPGAWRLGCILELGTKMLLRQHEETCHRKQAQLDLLGHFSIVGDSWKRGPLEPTLHVLEAGTELAATEPSSRALCLPFYLFWFGGHTRQAQGAQGSQLERFGGLMQYWGTQLASMLSCCPASPASMSASPLARRVSPDQGARVGDSSMLRGPSLQMVAGVRPHLCPALLVTALSTQNLPGVWLRGVLCLCCLSIF